MWLYLWIWTGGDQAPDTSRAMQMHTAPPDAPRGHEARTNPGRPGNTRAGPGCMRRVSQQCERLYTPDTIGVVVTPVLCPAGVAGVYAMSTGTTGCVRVMCASDGSRWNLELDDRRWVLSSCARIAWNPGCTPGDALCPCWRRQSPSLSIS